jgi:hypothetical protein
MRWLMDVFHFYVFHFHIAIMVVRRVHSLDRWKGELLSMWWVSSGWFVVSLLRVMSTIIVCLRGIICRRRVMVTWRGRILILEIRRVTGCLVRWFRKTLEAIVFIGIPSLIGKEFVANMSHILS